MAKAKKGTKAIAVPTAQSREEVEQLLGDIGRLQRQVVHLEKKMNDKLATIQEEFGTEVAPLNEEIEQKFALIHGYAEAHRDELCPGDAKTAKLSTGELLWRLPPPSVRITSVEVVLATLRRLGLFQFIRSKDEVNKEAILSDPESVRGISGISISQTESFIVKPVETEIERAVTSKATTKVAA